MLRKNIIFILIVAIIFMFFKKSCDSQSRKYFFRQTFESGIIYTNEVKYFCLLTKESSTGSYRITLSADSYLTGETYLKIYEDDDYDMILSDEVATYTLTYEQLSIEAIWTNTVSYRSLIFELSCETTSPGFTLESIHTE